MLKRNRKQYSKMGRVFRCATVAALISILFGGPAASQMYIYPSEGQSAEQQSKDEATCREWATKQTGIDPDNLNIPQAAAKDSADAGKTVAGSTAVGGAIGGLGGSMGGQFGKGVAVGALVGAVGGMVKTQMDQGKQKKSQDQQKTDLLNQYNRAFRACIEGKGYTVR
jgi:hypothetical protein